MVSSCSLKQGRDPHLLRYLNQNTERTWAFLLMSFMFFGTDEVFIPHLIPGIVLFLFMVHFVLNFIISAIIINQMFLPTLAALIQLALMLLYVPLQLGILAEVYRNLSED